MKRQLQYSTPQPNRTFKPFCHPIPEPYSLGICARGWGHNRLSGWQTDSKSSIFPGREVLQLPLKIISFFFCFLFCLGALHADQEAYRSLDELGLQCGTDKASSLHNYTKIYSRYFAPLKDKPIKFLEIGIYQGASVKMWESYFKQATLHFIDISLKHVQYYSKRSRYHVLDQSKPRDLLKLIRKVGGDFDIIIDDGGHTMEQQITSFQHLFPHVKSGGMYIIEDLHTSYWENYGGGDHSHTTVAFLKNLIDDVNYVGATTSCASHANIPSEVVADMTLYRKEIESIHFYDSLAIIFKR